VIDPIAPLLHPWFYSGSIHDLFGIRNNLVITPGKREPSVLDERHDAFLREFGCGFLAEVGPAVATKMSEAKRLNDTAKQQIRTPDQIADIVNAATQFQEQFNVISNHVSIVSAINDYVAGNNLVVVGELEQAIATSEDAVGHFDWLMRLARDERIPRDSIKRLILIYTLRYEGRAAELLQQLHDAFPQYSMLMRAMIMTCGAAKRKGDDILAGRTKISQLFTDIRALYDAQPKVLDQFRPLLVSIIDRLKRGTLDLGQYPFVGGRQSEVRPRRLIVFFVGGATYAEMRAAVQSVDIDVIVGGTSVHNAESFLRNEVEECGGY
jgi:hypothetical protein